jgi:hypothetical protein
MACIQLVGTFADTYISDGKRCRVKAHRGVLEIEGMLVAKVNDSLQIQSIDVWYDPMSLFEQVTKNGAEVIIEDDKAPTLEGTSASRCPMANM